MELPNDVVRGLLSQGRWTVMEEAMGVRCTSASSQTAVGAMGHNQATGNPCEGPVENEENRSNEEGKRTNNPVAIPEIM